ncbi:MAG: hypothetical protein IJF97_00865 [Eggerthellaceae bacterium]|nr:hypothetical protein [Eggerthellaceae bacterium]MBQ3342713.1 hypothetical protein [Kiritimatiellia bacterium]
MSRLEKLKEVEAELERLMKSANSRVYATLSREYRAVIREIEEIEGSNDDLDEIAQIVARSR